MYRTTTGLDVTAEELIAHREVRVLLNGELSYVCMNFKSYERPLSWAAITEPFTQVR